MPLLDYVKYLFSMPDFCAAFSWWHSRPAGQGLPVMSDVYDGDIWKKFTEDPFMQARQCALKLLLVGLWRGMYTYLYQGCYAVCSCAKECTLISPPQVLAPGFFSLIYSLNPK